MNNKRKKPPMFEEETQTIVLWHQNEGNKRLIGEIKP